MFKTKKIKIGYQTYTLKRNDKILSDMGILGRCHKNLQRIEYCGEFPVDTVKDTVIHEVLHAIWHNYLDQGEVDEETAVTMMAHGLTQVARDNPKFFREWLG